MNKNEFQLIILIGVVIIFFIAGFYILEKIKSPEVETEEVSDEIKINDETNNEINLNSNLLNEKNMNENLNVSIKNDEHIVSIMTNLGEIRFKTYDVDAPKAVNNFVTLAQKGFYNGTIFHRVIDGFMVQGGDPSGTGMGGPGYTFEDELNPETDSYKKGYRKGVVAMANAGPNTNGSQFFIMVNDYPLPNNYTIFGEVILGQDVADAIAKLKTDSNDRPISQVMMEKVTVIKVE